MPRQLSIDPAQVKPNSFPVALILFSPLSDFMRHKTGVNHKPPHNGSTNSRAKTDLKSKSTPAPGLPAVAVLAGQVPHGPPQPCPALVPAFPDAAISDRAAQAEDVDILGGDRAG